MNHAFYVRFALPRNTPVILVAEISLTCLPNPCLIV
jgi:hypothetical protein